MESNVFKTKSTKRKNSVVRKKDVYTDIIYKVLENINEERKKLKIINKYMVLKITRRSRRDTQIMAIL